MFSTHTGMLSGQERKLNFLGATGPPDIVQADKPRVRISPSLPYLLLHNELKGENHLALWSSEALAVCTRGSGQIKHVPLLRDETTYFPPPLPLLCPPPPHATALC